jgi:hypothetical protein
MVTCVGDILLNRNPKDIKELESSVVVRESESGKKQYAMPFDVRFESYKEFLEWFDKNFRAPVLLDGKTRMNGTLVMTDEVDPNKSGDIIIRNNGVLFQPVLPMF